LITQIKMQIGVALPIRFPEQVKLMRPAGGNAYTVAEQTTIEVGTGMNVASVKMQAQPGDRLALHGLPFTYAEAPVEGYEFYCNSPESVLGGSVGDIALGATTEIPEVLKGRLPLAATIEPDADNDGFGDETQDKCPQSASTQAPCPTIALESVGVTGRGKATVYVTSSTETPVGVTGTVKLGKGKTATLRGGTQTVAPGKLVPFTVRFSKALRKKLKELPKAKKLTLQLTARATNVIGQVSTDTTTAKLRGQG